MRIYYGGLSNDITSIIDKNKDCLIITNRLNEVKRKVVNHSNIIVTNIWALALKLYREYGLKKEIIDDGMQKIFFLKAIKSSDLKVLKNYDVEMLDSIVSIYNEEFKNDLEKKLYQTEIIQDIEAIIDKYKFILGSNYIDKVNVYLSVLDSSKKIKRYENMEIYVDDIYDYSKLELKFLINFLENKSGHILLLNSRFYDNELVKEKNKFVIESLKSSIEEIFLGSENKYDNYFSEYLFNSKPVSADLDSNFSIYSFGDIYGEVEYVANKIKEEVYKNNLKYHEIAITSPSIENYYNYLQLILENNGINVRRERFENKNFYQFIINLLEMMSEEITNEKFIKIVKSGYFYINDLSISNFQKYIYENQLSYEKLDLSIFNGEEISEIKNIFEALRDIQKSQKVGEFIQEFYLYLNNLEITKKLNEDFEEWNTFVDLIDKLYLSFENESLDLDFIKKIFAKFLNKKEKDIFVNEVFVGNLNEVYRKNFKVVFLLGVTDDKVPLQVKENTLLNSKEKQNYYKNYPLFDQIYKQELEILSVLINSVYHTYISYYKVGSDRRIKNPARFVKRLNEIFNLSSAKKLLYTIDKSLISKLSTFSDKTILNNIINYLKNFDKYREFLEKRQYFSNFSEVGSVNSDLINKRFNGKIYLSPSSINLYYQNPFNYFCKYVLNIEPIKQNKYDSLLVGEYIHYLFEKTIKNNLLDADYDLFKELMNDYILKKGINKNRLKYLLIKLTMNAYYLLKILKKHLDISKYRPKYFEMSLTNNDFSKFTLNINNFSVTINGIVDRIDVYGNRSIVIDYKSGDKKIDYNLLLQGVDFQLFLYGLFISKMTDYRVDGAFYMPSFVKFDGSDKNYRLRGVFLDDPNVVENLGGEALGEVVDAISRGKIRENNLLKEEDFELIYKFILKKIEEMVTNISNGIFPVNPLLMTKDFENPYDSISGIDYRYKNYIKQFNYSKLEALDKMKEEVR